MHADVRTYLAALPPSTRRVLEQLCSEIVAVAPDSKEQVSLYPIAPESGP